MLFSFNIFSFPASTDYLLWDFHVIRQGPRGAPNRSESVATLPPFGPIEGQKWFDQISSQWESQKNRFTLIYFGKIQFLPPWNITFMSYRLCALSRFDLGGDGDVEEIKWRWWGRGIWFLFIPVPDWLDAGRSDIMAFKKGVHSARTYCWRWWLWKDIQCTSKLQVLENYTPCTSIYVQVLMVSFLHYDIEKSYINASLSKALAFWHQGSVRYCWSRISPALLSYGICQIYVNEPVCCILLIDRKKTQKI
jgi:hypothetical protein